ncbi:TetR/AcrR family transcriptional regulator [Devosia ginsengisoli]|uniref:TetR/AcrR family transcriptional regulator n=1 Tax=Devosia ginsengisoli TaxID=400770 RepID=A0A5B8LZA3_9HYPH|nr:TetR/AcrR family transcriptional regulator [Devosia ginsengisoli]QDZ12702.1 TetR/AcrR family transcriptional regulator [Devosia ginsengisoli]
MDVVLDKRERILAAAARLIVRNGLQCSMAAIAEEASVATGSLYNYFDSKEALVLGVYTRVTALMTESLVTPSGGDSGEEPVRRYIESYIDFIWEDPDRARLFDYLDNNPLITLRDAKAIFGAFVEHGIAMIEAAQAAGVVRAGPPTMIMSFMRGSIRNTLKRRRMTETRLTDADRQLVAAMCWAAIAA